MKKLLGGFGLLLMMLTGSHMWSRALPGSQVPDQLAQQLRGGRTCGAIRAFCTVFMITCPRTSGVACNNPNGDVKSKVKTNVKQNPSVRYCSIGNNLGCNLSWASKNCSE
jgi:hypothetical protein